MPGIEYIWFANVQTAHRCLSQFAPLTNTAEELTLEETITNTSTSYLVRQRDTHSCAQFLFSRCQTPTKRSESRESLTRNETLGEGRDASEPRSTYAPHDCGATRFFETNGLKRTISRKGDCRKVEKLFRGGCLVWVGRSYS